MYRLIHNGTVHTMTGQEPRIMDILIKDKKIVAVEEWIDEETGKPITKSGLNHRLRKISEIASELKEDVK